MTDQLRSIFARWLANELDRAAISDDMKDLFAEAKGNGFDAKALRLAFRQKVKSDEPESDADRATKALVENYLEALDEPPPARRAPARVVIIDESAAPIKVAAEEREPPNVQHLPVSAQADDAQPEGGIVGGSRANSWMMQENIPADLVRTPTLVT